MTMDSWQREARQRIGRRRFVASFAGAGVAGFLAACSGGDKSGSMASPVALGTSGPAQAADEPKRGGTLTVGIGGEPRSLDPHTGVGGEEHAFDHLVYDQVVSYDEKGRPDPTRSIAERWEQPDPLKVVLKLRPGITIQQSGEPVDGALVKWNLDRASAPGTTPANDLSAIARIDVVNATEVVLNLKEPSASLLTNLGDRGGFILSRKHFEAVGKDAIIRQPLSSGAFNLTRWVSDASMTFERNPDYWRKDAQGRPMPYVDRIEMKVIPDATVRVAALETGETDLSDTPSSDFNRLQANKQLHAAMFTGSSTSLLFINDRFPPMDNVWFRRALASAFDRQNYIQNFLTGAEQPAADQFWEASAKNAGITIDWARPELNGSRNRVYTGQGADGSAGTTISGWGMRVDPDGNCGQFYTQTGAYNAGQAPVPEVEPLIVKARQLYDQQERRKLYSEIQHKAVEQVYSNILFHYVIVQSHASTKVGNLDALYGGEGKPRYANLWIQ